MSTSAPIAPASPVTNSQPLYPQERDNYICQYCGKDGLASLENWHDSTVDHFIPQKLGGTDQLNNLKTSCGYCNAIKGDRVFETVEDARKFVMARRAELQKDYEKVLAKMRDKR
jgi:5-methylcytosine-specific restriction endonuclease McrA